MASDEPGPGQQYAIQTRKHIAALHRARPDITIEIQWYPAHKGIAGNVKADERAKIAAEEPDTRGVEWRKYSDRTEVRAMPLPQSLANLKRKISEKKWVEACQWAGGRISKKKYRMQKSQRPDSTVAGSTKEACLAILPDQDGALSNRTVPQLDEEPAHPAMLVVPTPEPDPEASLQGVTGVEGPAKDPVGGGAEGDREGEGPVEDPGPPGGREMQAGGTGLPLYHGRGRAGAGRKGYSERGAGGGAAGVLRGARSGSRGAGHGGHANVLAHA